MINIRIRRSRTKRVGADITRILFTRKVLVYTTRQDRESDDSFRFCCPQNKLCSVLILYISTVHIILLWSTTAFPTRSSLQQKREIIFLRSYYHGLDFRTHRQKPDGSRARIIHLMSILRTYKWVYSCAHKYIIYAACSRSVNAFARLLPRPVRGIHIENSLRIAILEPLVFPFRRTFPETFIGNVKLDRANIYVLYFSI